MPGAQDIPLKGRSQEPGVSRFSASLCRSLFRKEKIGRCVEGGEAEQYVPPSEVSSLAEKRKTQLYHVEEERDLGAVPTKSFFSMPQKGKVSACVPPGREKGESTNGERRSGGFELGKVYGP